jgi:CheY-like chemotaxis protein
MMPQLSGAQLIAAVRRDAADQGYPAPPCVPMSAAGRKHADTVDADALVRKPFDIEVIDTLLAGFVPVVGRGESGE